MYLHIKQKLEVMMNLQKSTDQALIDGFMQGNQSCINELILRYKDKVFTYIFLLVKNKHLAEDIFQETFIKVAKSLKNGKYSDNGKFSSWVVRIAHNMVIDVKRKEKQSQIISNEDSKADIFSTAGYFEQSVEDQYISDSKGLEVKKLLKELPFEQEQVVILKIYMGLSFKEIAEFTNVSINTALGRMRYALINLRKVIEDNKYPVEYIYKTN